MSRLSELSPRTSTHGIHVRVSLSDPAIATIGRPQDVQQLRSWFEHDFRRHVLAPHRDLNWSACAGLMLALVVSAGFWTGLVWTAARFWK